MHVVRVYRRYWVVWCGIWWVGVRQFLDLGSGLPTAGNVHEVAQDLKPGCRVVYVDIDPGVVAESDKLLAGKHDVAIFHADLRQPEQVFDGSMPPGDVGCLTWVRRSPCSRSMCCIIFPRGSRNRSGDL